MIAGPFHLLEAHLLRLVAHPEHACGHAADDGIGGHVLRHHGVGADHGVVADRDPAQDARAVADPDVMANAHVALVDPLQPDRPLDLDDAVVEVDQHHAVGDHALPPDRDVLVGRDRALLAEHGLRADRDDALVTADLRAVPQPRPAPELDTAASPDLDHDAARDEGKAVQLQPPSVGGHELPA